MIIQKKKCDIFFGNAPLCLLKINELSKTVSDAHFMAQINRYLLQNNSQMNVVYETSSPPFAFFLGKLNRDLIGNIKIYARTDRNNAVKATLSCEILLECGLITITTQWCAYKKSRSDEIISTLLVPLFLSGLHKKTFLNYGEYLESEESLEPLVEGDDFEHGIRGVFSLSKYPNAFLEEYISELTKAATIGEQNLSMSKSLEKFHCT